MYSKLNNLNFFCIILNIIFNLLFIFNFYLFGIESKYYFEFEGTGSTIEISKIDALQNALLSFLKTNVSSVDIKNNYKKIYKEFFEDLNKIYDFFEKYEVISKRKIDKNYRIVLRIKHNEDLIFKKLKTLNISIIT